MTPRKTYTIPTDDDNATTLLPSLLTTPYAKCKYIVMGAAEDDSSSSKQQMGLYLNNLQDRCHIIPNNIIFY